MEQIICVRYVKNAKVGYVNKGKYDLKIGDSVLVDTGSDTLLAKVASFKDKNALPEKVEIKDIYKVATSDDLNKIRSNEKEAKEALKFAREEASKLKLSMKILTAEYNLDKSKIVFYFTAEDRIDFRELVRILASFVRTRVELRQIGPRDEVTLYESLGMCGRETCCRKHLKEFKSITIKDAKEQGLQINMEKLSGVCGKLMCCLKYEEEEYKENQKNLPRYNDIVKVIETGEEGRVCNLDILKMKVKVKFGDTRENERYEVFTPDKLSWKKKNLE